MLRAIQSLVPQFRKHLINELVKALSGYKNSLDI